SGIRLPVRIHEPALVQIAAPKREADHREQARMPLATPYRPRNETNIATPMVAATAPSIPPPLLAPCRRKRRDTYERSHERRDEEGERRHGRSVATRGIEVGASRTAAGATLLPAPPVRAGAAWPAAPPGAPRGWGRPAARSSGSGRRAALRQGHPPRPAALPGSCHAYQASLLWMHVGANPAPGVPAIRPDSSSRGHGQRRRSP